MECDSPGKKPRIKPFRKGERLMVVGDNHGDLACLPACRAALDFMRFWKPAIRIHLGDNWDFRWLRKSADKDEKDAKITDDINAGIEFLDQYRPTHFLRGNHDERIYDVLESSTGFMRELSSRVVRDMQRALGRSLIFPYCKRRGVLRIGDFSFIHGYSTGVYAVRRAVLSYGNVCMGHVHRTDMVKVERSDEPIGFAAGCLCDVDLPYNRGQLGTLAQCNGWAYGVKVGNKVKLWLAERFNGEWIFPSEISTYA